MFNVLSESEVATSQVQLRRRKMNGRFLKGPILIAHLTRASRLPGKAISVYLALCHQVDLTGKAEVSVPSSLLKEMGVDRDAKSRAVRSLEAAGLIRTNRKQGCCVRMALVS